MKSSDGDESYDYLFKIVLIGDAGVGKTCIVQRFKSGTWVESQASTIGVDFCMKSCDVEGKQIKLQVWDTAGQERFRTITQAYYRSAHAVICAFDLTREQTFDNLAHWIDDVSKYCAPNVVKLLVGNKCDMTSQRKISANSALAQAEHFGAIEYVETSAKENTNIDTSFMKIAAVLVEQQGDIKLSDSGIKLLPSGSTKSVGNACSC